MESSKLLRIISTFLKAVIAASAAQTSMLSGRQWQWRRAKLMSPFMAIASESHCAATAATAVRWRRQHKI